MLDFDEWTSAFLSCLDDDGTQFPHISRPLIAAKLLEDLFLKSGHLLRCSPIQFFEKVLREEREIFRSVSEWRQGHRQRCQGKKEGFNEVL